MIEISDKQKDMILHASGLSRGRKQYRSHYCTQHHNPEWIDLVDRGLAKGPVFNPMLHEDHAFFYLTELGIKLARTIKKDKRSKNV